MIEQFISTWKDHLIENHRMNVSSEKLIYIWLKLFDCGHLLTDDSGRSPVQEAATRVCISEAICCGYCCAKTIHHCLVECLMACEKTELLMAESASALHPHDGCCG